MDAARMAAQSDPDRNFHFRRRWAEGPPLKRERPPLTGISEGAKFEGDSSGNEYSHDLRILQATWLDRRSEVELTAGRHDVAEHLSHRAEALRAEAGS